MNPTALIVYVLRWFLARPRKGAAASIRRPWSAAARKSVAISIINAERKGALAERKKRT
jgi:hypothetical protein